MLDLTPFIRPWARRKLAAHERLNPADVQRSTLLGLLRAAEGTLFGRDHRFAQIRSVEDFQARVPLRRYADFWNGYWSEPFPQLRDVTWPGTIRYFAKTSGTTLGLSKNIPLSRQMIRANRRAGLRTLLHHVASRPDSKFLRGKIFLLGGSTGFESPAPGIACGDLSGISTATYPLWAQCISYPPSSVAGIKDWEKRIELILADPQSRLVRGIAGQTTWLLSFLERAVQAGPGCGATLGEVFPNLELIVCGGMNFTPYAERLARLIGEDGIRLAEAYVASEGFIAIGQGFPGRGMQPVLDNGLFLEFVPLDELERPTPRRYWMETAEPHVDYALAVTSNSGLWACLIGDAVRFEDAALQRMKVVGRIDQMMSPFGEHLLETELALALTTSGQAVGHPIKEYAVGALFPKSPARPGHHLYIVEFSQYPPAQAVQPRFLEAVDSALKSCNADYCDVRVGNLVLAEPKLLVAAPGAFEAWMRRRGKLGGQNKMPRILLDPESLEDLRRHVSAFARAAGPST